MEFSDSHDCVGGQMYRRIVEAVPEGIWVVDLQGRTTFSNQRMAEILGVDFKSMPDQSCFACVFPEDVLEAQRHFARGLAGNYQPFDFRLRRADGSAIWVSISCMPLLDEAGAPAGLLGLFSDISERKRTEDALRESEHRFRAMADTAPVMVWVTDSDKRGTFFNKCCLEFTGDTIETKLGDGWLAGLHPDDREQFLTVFSSSIDARQEFRSVFRLRRADGEYRWILCTGVPRSAPGDVFVGYIGSCVDITDLKRAQEEALSRQKLESLGVLANGIAHDFNNILGSILASTELAIAMRAEGLAVEDELRRIRATSVRGAEIVQQLMTYAGNDSPVFEPLDVSALVRDLLELLKVSISKNATLEAELDTDLPAVWANAPQIRQVVMNLVINASEAIGTRDGKIRVTTARVMVRAASSFSHTPSDPLREYVRLDVSDTGSGMTPEVKAKMFDPFFTTKEAGRGLGLAAVQGIVRRHEGTISVATDPVQGSRFEILLPRIEEPARNRIEVAVCTSAPEPLSTIGTVLVVDDEDILRIAVSKLLRKKRLDVIEAGDGTSGATLFRANARNIDVVLLDVTLPGLSCRDLLDEMRRIRPDVKVILTSAFSQDKVFSSIGERNPWGYIRKPYHFSELASLLERAFLDKAS